MQLATVRLPGSCMSTHVAPAPQAGMAPPVDERNVDPHVSGREGWLNSEVLLQLVRSAEMPRMPIFALE